jgi:hypothetical protein
VFPERRHAEEVDMIGLETFRVLPLAAAVSVAVCLSDTAAAQTPAKPVLPEVINAYFKGPPDTLTDMIVESQLVVRGRVTGTSPRDAPPVTRTAYRLEVIELLRANDSRAFDARPIDIIRSGGDRDRGTYIEHAYEAGFPPFEIGHEYVLFLVWNNDFGAWVPAFGPDSAYDLTSGVLDSPGKASVTSTLRGMAVPDFLDRIRFGREIRGT